MKCFGNCIIILTLICIKEHKALTYVISLICLLAFYVCVIANMKRMKNTKLFNCVFSIAIFSCYLYVVIKVYSSVGFYEWNFQNTLPVANVSPFMFTLVGIIHFLPSRIKKRLYLLISLLSVGVVYAPKDSGKQHAYG